MDKQRSHRQFWLLLRDQRAGDYHSGTALPSDTGTVRECAGTGTHSRYRYRRRIRRAPGDSDRLCSDHDLLLRNRHAHLPAWRLRAGHLRRPAPLAAGIGHSHAWLQLFTRRGILRPLRTLALADAGAGCLLYRRLEPLYALEYDRNG